MLLLELKELSRCPQPSCTTRLGRHAARKYGSRGRKKGLSFKEHRPELFAGDQLRPEYLKLNPNGVVPTLIDDGTPIIDS